MSSHYSRLEALPPGAQQVFDAAAKKSVFFSRPWFQNYIETVLPSPEQLRIYAAASDGQPCALLPMQIKADTRGIFRARTLAGLQNYYSSLFGLLVNERAGTAEFMNLAGQLRRAEEHWECLDFHPMDPDDPSFHDWLASLRRQGYWVDTYQCFGNWYMHVNGRNFAEYFEALPSQLKNTIKRKRKQFEANPANRLEIVQGGDKLEQAIADYIKIYNASWKVPEPYPDFIPGLIRSCAEQGWLRLGLAYVGETPAAAQIWIVQEGTAAIYKLAYDEQFAKQSIGSILTTALMQYAVDVDKVEVVDYLTGDDAYKRDWMSHRRERWGIVAYNPRSLGGLIEAARHFGGKWARQLRHKLNTSTAADSDKNR